MMDSVDTIIRALGVLVCVWIALHIYGSYRRRKYFLTEEEKAQEAERKQLEAIERAVKDALDKQQHNYLE